MIGLLLALLILFVIACRWKWDIHLGRLFLELNGSLWGPFATEHGPKALPWWQLVKVMPYECTGGGWRCWNVFVYTRRTTRCHFVAWRSPGMRSVWRLERSELVDWSKRWSGR